MVEQITDAGDGKWLWYKMDPADLAIHVGRTPEEGVSVTWQGQTRLDDLISFFEWAVDHISSPHGYFRSWLMTREGVHPFPSPPWDIPRHMMLAAEYVRFERLLVPPRSDDDTGYPTLAVFANMDRLATSREDTQESVGVYLLQPGDLPSMSGRIAELVAVTSSRFFPSDQPYRLEMVRRRLSEADGDLGLVWNNRLAV